MKILYKIIIIISIFSYAAVAVSELSAEKNTVKTKSEVNEDQKKKENRKKYLKSLKKSILYDSSTERRNSILKIKSLEKNEKDDFVPVLKKLAIEDLDYFVRESCVRTLGEMDRHDAENVFIQALNDSKSDVKRAAIKSLSKIESKQSAPVYEMIKKEDFTEYSNLLTSSIRLLGKMKYSEAAPFLKDKSMEPEIHKENRRAILLYFGLAEVGNMKDFLLDIAKDDAEEISFREYAVNSLGKINEKSVISDLHTIYEEIRSLNNKQERVKYSRMKLQIIAALIRLGDNSVEPEIMAAARDDDPNIRVKAVRQMGEMKLESARDLLEYKAEHDQSTNVKKEAKKALSRLDGSKTDDDEDEETLSDDEKNTSDEKDTSE